MAHTILNRTTRIKLEELAKTGKKVPEMAKELHLSKVIIYKELGNALTRLDYLERRYHNYSAEQGQEYAENSYLEMIRK